MTSERGPTATEAPRMPSTSTVPPAATPFDADAELARLRTLKRPRESTPTSSDSPMSAGDMSPSKIARLVGFARQSHPSSADEVAETEAQQQEPQQQEPPQQEPQQQQQHHHREPQEGAVEDEEEDRRRLAQLEQSDDPPAPAENVMVPDDNRPQGAPPDAEDPDIAAAAAAAARALSSVTIPTGHHVTGNDAHEVSPQSGTSGASLADGDGHVVDSPTPMDVDQRHDEAMYTPQPDAPMEDKAGGSLTYPGAMPTPGQVSRMASMPITGSQTPSGDMAPRSPNSGNKKHKCPYCDTEFTRHHNLKSHLLTHSQEKPYVCQSCNMRFRRLHDLKRHSKLHTGEKPHVCPSCDRKFARGDALARHSKGAGGCAGRRQTMNSFSMKDGYDGLQAADSSVLSEGLYEGGGGGGSAADLTDEDRRRLSMPSIKAQHVVGQAGSEGYNHPNTYPPTGARAGGLYPPNAADRGSSSSTTSPTVAPSSHTPQTSVSSIPFYSQSGMTESPKAQSPGAQANATGQLRGGHDPQQHSLLPLVPHGSNNASTDQDAAGRVQARAAAAQGSSGTGVIDPGMWTYFQHLESMVKRLTSQFEAEARNNAQLVEKLNAHEQHIAALTAEVAALRQQLAPPPAPAVPEHQVQHQHEHPQPQEQPAEQEQDHQQVQVQQHQQQQQQLEGQGAAAGEALAA
ncbi:hypothetical protein VTJ83DRAFT_1972 [Remersonia thermophila]|uniref:C2H2-type domain-containing protein n=1 Tax=Remersonia thermophila TaxID=72144 RepID=A0ABR4DHE9_9PEZI